MATKVLTAYELLERFPTILNTVLFWDDFYIIAKMNVNLSKSKIGIYKNWLEEIILLDEVIKFKRYYYNWLPNLVVWREWDEYFIMNNSKMLWPFKREIVTAELISSGWLYVVQKNDKWIENLIYNNNIVIENIEECEVLSDKISSNYIIIKYRIWDDFIVQINWTEMIKTKEKIDNIGFEQWNIPFVIYENWNKEYIDLPSSRGLV